MTKTPDSRFILAFNLCVAALFFLLPTHFFWKWGLSQAYVRGLLIDYLLPKLYASDILALVLVGLGLFQLRPKVKSIPLTYLMFGGLTLLVVLAQLTREYSLPATVMGLRLVLMVTLGWVIYKLSHLLKPKWMLNAVLLAILFQSSLGWYQFVTQHSLAGYMLFGEPTIPVASGLATASFWGAERVLPYGTTAHPNVLAGFLAVYLSWLVNYGFKAKFRARLYITVAALVIGFLTLCLTFSISGYLTFGVGLLVILIQNKMPVSKTTVALGAIASLILVPVLIQLAAAHFPNNPSLTRRAHLNQNAVQLWLQKPLLGVGLSSNAAVGENLSAIQEPVRFAQPTHHVPLLWLSETGILGGLWLLSLLSLIWPKLKDQDGPVWWLLLLPLAALDHYVLTTEAGLLLLLFLSL